MSTTDIKTAEWLEDLEIRAEYGSATLKYDIAATLVAARRMKNLTQAALANIAGVSQAYIAKLESGEANPTIGRIGAILASIWLKLQINPVLLLNSEHRDDTPSISLSPQISGSGEIVQATADNTHYIRTSHASALGQPSHYDKTNKQGKTIELFSIVSSPDIRMVIRQERERQWFVLGQTWLPMLAHEQERNIITASQTFQERYPQWSRNYLSGMYLVHTQAAESAIEKAFKDSNIARINTISSTIKMPALHNIN
jgi:transcriptional regulator with XRE-family HTH domain